MKLKNLHEGIGFRSDVTQSDIENVPEKSSLSAFLQDNGRFVFRDVDHPDDFIKFEPLQQAKKLNLVPSDRDALRSFEGAQIYYAYAIAESDDIELPQTTAPPAASKQLITQVQQIDKFDTNIQLKKGISDREAQLRRKDMIMEPEQIQETQNELDILKQMQQVLVDNNVNSITKLQSLEKTASTTTKSFKKRVLRGLRTALGHAIKDPRGKREITLQRRVIAECVKQYTRSVDVVYELILYPKSDSTFSKQLAESFASIYGGIAKEIPKALGKNVTIAAQDMNNKAQSLHQNALSGGSNAHRMGRSLLTPEEHQQWIKSITIPGTGIPVTDKRWPDLWVEKETAKLRENLKLDSQPNKIPKTKDARMNSKRRYAQLFELPPEAIEAGLEILIVDDNVHSSGTMENLHSLVNGLTPKRIDMFVPFLFR